MKTLTRCLIGVILLAVATGCDKHHPSPTGPTGPTGPTPPLSRVTGLQVSGADRLAPGAAGQLTLTAVKSDGSREDVTARAKWGSDRPDIVSIGPDGRVTGHAIGTASISGEFDVYIEQRRVLVVPANTFVLSGSVRQSNFPIADAKVEVVSAAVGAGMSVVSDAAGRFELFGVAGQLKLRVGKDAYAATFRTVDMSRDRTVEVELDPLIALPEALTGTYVVTFSMATCASDTGFPPELRKRTYQASLTTDGDRIDVRLSGATFVINDGTGDHFSIWRTPGAFVFQINKDVSYLPDIQEVLAPERTLAIYGTGPGTGTDKRLTATIEGGFVLNPYSWDPTPACKGQIAVSLVKQ